MSRRHLLEIMTAAFPGDLHDDVVAVSRFIPETGTGSLGSFEATVAGQPVTVPYRIYNEEPTTGYEPALSLTQRMILGCWYTRHHDGYVRQRYLEQIIGVPLPWIVPFVVKLAGEYVIEIVEIVRRELADIETSATERRAVYGRFAAENPQFIALTAQRAASYWDCYYRSRFPSLRHYPGKAIIDTLSVIGPASDIGLR